MDSIKRLLAVMGTIVVLMALAPVASAGSHQGFYLEKTCQDADVEDEPLGYFCTVTHSDFKWIPAGTDIRYPSQNGDGSVVQASIEIKNGSTRGACTWDEDPGAQDPLANCVFSAGTGRLTQFKLDVDVFVTEEELWIWSGTYWFGR